MRLTLAQTLRNNPGKPQDEVREDWLRRNPGTNITLPCGPPAQVCDYPGLENIEGRHWTCSNCGSRYRKSWRRNGGWIPLKSWQFYLLWTIQVLMVPAAIICVVYDIAGGPTACAGTAVLCVTLLTTTNIRRYRKPSPTF